MTRIETLVDAAFAFALTMLVISIGEIPKSPPELFELSKDIPAFVFSALSIGAVWLAHAKWSRTFGLQDSMLSLFVTIPVGRSLYRRSRFAISPVSLENSGH